MLIKGTQKAWLKLYFKMYILWKFKKYLQGLAYKFGNNII